MITESETLTTEPGVPQQLGPPRWLLIKERSLALSAITAWLALLLSI